MYVYTFTVYSPVEYRTYIMYALYGCFVDRMICITINITVHSIDVVRVLEIGLGRL